MNLLRLLVDNRFTLTAVILFTSGFLNVLLQRDLIYKVVGFNIMDSSTFLFLAARGYIEGRQAAILSQEAAGYVNPIPAGLVLTGIVVSVSVSAFSLALIQRIYQRYGTTDMHRLILLMRKEGTA